MQIAVTQDNPLSIDELVGHLETTKKELTAANKIARQLTQTKATLESQIMEMLEQGDDSDQYLLAITESEEPAVSDWDLTLAYVIANKGWHLLQRRLVVAALREELSIAGDIPGVEMKTTRRLSISK